MVNDGRLAAALNDMELDRQVASCCPTPKAGQRHGDAMDVDCEAWARSTPSAADPKRARTEPRSATAAAARLPDDGSIASDRVRSG